MRINGILGAPLLLSVVAVVAQAQTTVKRFDSDKSIIANAIWAGDTLYVSGQLPAFTPADPAKGNKPTIEGDTKAQTISTLNVIQGILKEQGHGTGYVVQTRVYLVPDPTGKLDFAGMNEATSKNFGTGEQPNKPVRGTIQASVLAVPNALVEIEVVAVRSK